MAFMCSHDVCVRLAKFRVTQCMQRTQQHCCQPAEFNLNRGQDAGHDHDPTCQTADWRQDALQANLARTILHVSHV